MISPRESFEHIAKLIERVLSDERAGPVDLKAALLGAHTLAALQAANLRRREAFVEATTYRAEGGALH